MQESVVVGVWNAKKFEQHPQPGIPPHLYTHKDPANALIPRLHISVAVAPKRLPAIHIHIHIHIPTSPKKRRATWPPNIPTESKLTGPPGQAHLRQKNARSTGVPEPAWRTMPVRAFETCAGAAGSRGSGHAIGATMRAGREGRDRGTHALPLPKSALLPLPDMVYGRNVGAGRCQVRAVESEALLSAIGPQEGREAPWAFLINIRCQPCWVLLGKRWCV